MATQSRLADVGVDGDGETYTIVEGLGDGLTLGDVDGEGDGDVLAQATVNVFEHDMFVLVLAFLHATSEA